MCVANEDDAGGYSGGGLTGDGLPALTVVTPSISLDLTSLSGIDWEALSAGSIAVADPAVAHQVIPGSPLEVEVDPDDLGELPGYEMHVHGSPYAHLP